MNILSIILLEQNYDSKWSNYDGVNIFLLLKFSKAK